MLIDTSGVNPFEGDPMDVIQALDHGRRRDRGAGAGPPARTRWEAAEQGAAFAATGVQHFIPTRLDIARRLGSVIAAADGGAFTLTEAGTGPGATDGLTALTPALLAARWTQHAATPAGRATHPTSTGPLCKPCPRLNPTQPPGRI
ncbi:MAG: hypothetical protein WDN04_11920 [Rhodospirillales bacterium]